MSETSEYLVFDGLEAVVALRVDDTFRAILPTIFPNWPHRITSQGGYDVFATVDAKKGKYTLGSPFMEKPRTFADPVNTICALIVELAWARLRQDPQLLCLHGAAVEFFGRLVLFPSTRRAGKSTLSVALAASGKTVFTDDFLPLEVSPKGQVQGISSGISPRLRLPLPSQIGTKAIAYISQRASSTNPQYRFVTPQNGELARFGQTAPIGGMVFLDRKDGATAALEPVPHAEALTNLITQNFSRAMNAAGILKMLEFITTSAPAYRLTYDRAEPAIELLENHFAQWDGTPPTLNEPAAFFESALDIELPTEVLDTTSGQFLHASGITVVSSDGKRFLTGRNGQSIHYLNDGAAAIWHLLDEPTSVAEAVEMLCAVYPDQSADVIKTDVEATFAEFSRNNLLQKADAICQTEGIEASCSDSVC